MTTERLSVPALFSPRAPSWPLPGPRRRGAADPDDDSIILVAKRQLQDKLYGSTILLARPIGADRHVGFIINKPTQMTLGKLFPEHEPSQEGRRPGVPRRPGQPGSDLRAGAGQARAPAGARSGSSTTSTSRSTATWSTSMHREAAGAGALLRRHGAVAPGELPRSSSAACGTCSTRAPTSCCASRPTGCGKSWSAAPSGRPTRSSRRF